MSISIRQEALGALVRAVAALEGVEKIKGMTANNAADSAIRFRNSFEYVAMPEDDKIQGTSEKVIHTEGKMAEDVRTRRLPVSGRGST